MNAHEFINHELELTYLLKRKIIVTRDERDDVSDIDPIEEVENVQIDDVVVDSVGFKNIESALVILYQFLEEILTDVTLLSKTFKHI